MTTDQTRRAQFIAARPEPVVTIERRAYDGRFVVSINDVPMGVTKTAERAERLATSLKGTVTR